MSQTISISGEGATPAAEAKQVEANPAARRTARLRLRAAWMYYVEAMTQSEIADALGIGRVTVARLLSDARALHEVRISLSRDLAELPKLEIALEKAFGLGEVVLAPISHGDADPIGPIAAATGSIVSERVGPNTQIGLGWGRTLSRCLGFLTDRPVPGMSVLSLLGGVTKARAYNPSEFAWQFSRAFQADCFLIAAPAIVDSKATKQTLIDRCGLRDVFDRAKDLDTVVLSVGSMSGENSPFTYGMLTEAERASLLAKGAVGNLLYQYFDIEGRLVDNPVNERAMAVPLEVLRTVPNRILCSGGADKVEAMIGAMRLLKPTICVTDEQTAVAVLDRIGTAV
jgi:DNA-binding transcriptional regulator LsrR (DeoR family)